MIIGVGYVKTTHLKKCGQGEGSDLIFQGVPYQIPLVTVSFEKLQPSYCHNTTDR